MTWLFGDSFDFWNGTADMAAGAGPGSWDTMSLYNGPSGASPTATTTRFAAGQSLKLNFGSPSTQQISAVAAKGVTNTDAIHHIVFAVNRYPGAATYGCCAFTFSDGTNVQCTLALMQDGSFKLYTGSGYSGSDGTPAAGTVLLTTPVLVPAAWTGVEAEIKFDKTAGYLKIRINGNTSDDYASAANLNTAQGSTNLYANKLSLFDCGGTYKTSSGATSYLDDLLWFSAAGSAPNSWVGDVRAVQLMPATDAQAQMTPNSGTNNYSRVNQVIEDGDTTYVASSTAGQNDLYTIGALSATPSKIIGVQSKMAAKKTDTNTRQAYIQLKSGSTVSAGTTYTMGTSYAYASRVDTVDPNTSAAWTASALTSLQIGPYLVA